MLFAVSIYFLSKSYFKNTAGLSHSDREKNGKVTLSNQSFEFNLGVEPIREALGEPLIERELIEVSAKEPKEKRAIESTNATVIYTKTKEEIEALPLWEIRNGDDLVKSTAKVHIKILDAKGEKLVKHQGFKVFLWRNVYDEFWIRDAAVFDEESSSVLCDGHNGYGLEPGYYLVEFNGKSYGALQCSFTIKKNQYLELIEYTPYYFKKIKVNTYDQNGVKVFYPNLRYYFRFPDHKFPLFDLKQKVSPTLISYPGDVWYLISGSVLDSYGTRRSVALRSSWVDNEMYVGVFAGVTADLRILCGDLCNVEIKSDFVNESYIDVRLNEEKRYFDELAAAQKKYASAYGDVKEKPTIILPVTGVSIELSRLDYPLDLEVFNKAPSESSFFVKSKNGVYSFSWDDPPDSSEVFVRWTDHKTFISELRPIALIKNQVNYQVENLDLSGYEVRLHFSPTFMEMVKDSPKIKYKNRSFHANIENSYFSFRSVFSKKAHSDSLLLKDISFEYEAKYFSFFDDNIEEKFEPEEYMLDQDGYPLFKKAQILPLGYFFHALKESVNIEVPFSVEIDSSVKTEQQRIDISPLQNTLVLRAVDDTGAGLPWVEASLIGFDELAASEKLRSMQGLLPNVYAVNVSEDCDYEEEELAEIKKSYDALVKLLGSEKFAECYLRFGAWYDCKAKGITDSKGYMILRSAKLNPGEKYSLFFWHKSSDGHKPDKRINFIATLGITDLGAIPF